jgi:hypothetical protein
MATQGVWSVWSGDQAAAQNSPQEPGQLYKISRQRSLCFSFVTEYGKYCNSIEYRYLS